MTVATPRAFKESRTPQCTSAFEKKKLEVNMMKSAHLQVVRHHEPAQQRRAHLCVG
jgi:hypothetical protein